jgi:hypothetical protein
LMAIPTTISALLLSKKVMTAARIYFAKLDREKLNEMARS